MPRGLLNCGLWIENCELWIACHNSTSEMTCYWSARSCRSWKTERKNRRKITSPDLVLSVCRYACLLDRIVSRTDKLMYYLAPNEGKTMPNLDPRFKMYSIKMDFQNRIYMSKLALFLHNRKSQKSFHIGDTWHVISAGQAFWSERGDNSCMFSTQSFLAQNEGHPEVEIRRSIKIRIETSHP